MTYSRLIAILWFAVIMLLTAQPADRCATPTDADCIRAVYKGAPHDYTKITDIPAEMLLAPDPDGRYQVERGQQITVVTAAQLPADYTRFFLQRRPLQVTVSPTSAAQLIPPVGTTYTFTVTTDERGSTLLSFDLTAARPRPFPRPGQKPELGDVVVTTKFQVDTTTLHYTSYDMTGAVATAGSYAFLSDPADTTSAVSTYEGLRDGATTGLLIHKSDTHGASQATLFDSIEADDLFEWRTADDCWVRYTVTEVKPDPEGAEPRKLLTVEWMTYAFSGCSGPIAGSADASFAWGDLPDVGGASLTAPVIHGPFQIVPEDWTGAVEEPLTREPAGYSYSQPTGTSDIDEARRLPYWRDPTLAEGATLDWARSGDVSDPVYGYNAKYQGGESDVAISGYDTAHRREPRLASWRNGRGVRETRVVAGRPATVIYSPPGPSYDDLFPVTVWVYDSASDATYEIRGENTSLTGSNVDRLIAIARSLFEPRAQLTITAGEGGSVEPTGITTHVQGEPVTLTASWDDATHTFARWDGDCSGTATTCVLEMYANKTVTASYTPLPADRCTTPTAADCIRAVYKGAPDDHPQVQDIPDSLLIQPDSNGRYQVERGQQITVVTAAPLPAGYTRFYLQRRPQVRPSPTSHEQLIQPVGTTYTFTSIAFEGGASVLTFDLTAARPLPVQRPGIKPELGDVVVTTTFDVLTPPPAAIPVEVPLSAYNAEALPPGTYQFPALRSEQRPLIIQIPTTDHQIKWQEIILSDPGGISFCLADLAETSTLCLAQADGGEVYRAIPGRSLTDASVTISDVFDYIAASARTEPPPTAER